MLPMCALLTPVFDVRKLGLLLSAVSIPIVVFLFLKGFRLNSLITVGLFLTVPFLMTILWQFVKRTGINRILDFLRPAGWPTITSGQPMVRGIGLSDVPIAMISMTVGAIAFLSNEPIILALIIGTLLILPFWSGRYRLSVLLLLAGMLIPMSFMIRIYGSAFLVLCYMATVYRPSRTVYSRSFTVVTMLTLTALVILEFRSYLGVSKKLNPLLAFSAATSLIGLLVPFVLTYVFHERKKKLVIAVWVVSCMLTFLDFLLSEGVNEFLLFCGNLFCLVYFTVKWPSWFAEPRTIITALIIAGTAVMVIFNAYFLSKPILGGNEMSVSNMTVTGNRISGSKSVVNTASEYRPLAFLEYPLGIESPLNERIGTASLVLGHYLLKMFIPWPQAFYYGYDEVPLGDWMDPIAILSLLVHGALLLLVFYFGRSHPILAFGILAYLLSIFLFSNFIATIPGMIGDRLTYVASFGFCVSLGYVLTLVYQRLSTAVAKGMFAVAIGTLMVVWSGMTVARAAKWKGPLTLMRHDIRTVPNSAQAHNILASNLMQASFDPNTKEDPVEMRLEAIHHFRESLRIWPKTMNVWFDLGRAYMIVDDSERALLCFMSAYGLDSTFTYAAWNAAEMAQNLGRDSLAVEYYRNCIRFSPEMEEAYSRLSYIYLIRGEHEKSIADNRLAIAREPSWRAPYDNMVQVFEAIEMPDSVETYIRKRNAIGVP